jgi:hypothetical protein
MGTWGKRLTECSAPASTPSLQIHHVPRRLRQTRLIVPTDRVTTPLLANDCHGDPLRPQSRWPHVTSAAQSQQDLRTKRLCRLSAHLPAHGLPRRRCLRSLRNWSRLEAGVPSEPMQPDPSRLLAQLQTNWEHERHAVQSGRAMRWHLHRCYRQMDQAH